MKLTNYEWWRPGRVVTLCWIVLGLLGMSLARVTNAQGVSTTTVQGTVYLANGQAGAGTLVVSWPAFTTATGQAVAADSITVTIPADGFVSVNLAPNVGASPAGEYYTAVFYMSDGSVSTQYWQVPAGSQTTLAQVETQVMPAAQAVQAVSKSYVDQAITELAQGSVTALGGTLSGPLILNGDPTQELQAADKHYVDTQVATVVPLAGGNMTGALGAPAVNGVQAPATGSAQTTLQQAINAAGTNGAMEIPPTYTGTDTFSNANGVKVTDLRTSIAQQTERSVKEFGAICDGVTDDTNALQAALNYADTHGVALTIPQGTCKTHSLNWHGESIGGMGKQVSALMGFPGQDVLASMPDSPNMLQYTRLHDLTIYVDQSLDVSCSAAEGRAAAGSCQVSRLMEQNSIFSPGGNGLAGTTGTGAAWAVGNCAIAMTASTGMGGNGLRVAEIENLEIATTGTDPMAAQYPGTHSTHTCGMYLGQWPQWSEFRNIDIRGLNTGIAIPALPVTAPSGLTADSNRWQNITIQATHAFTAATGCNGVLDNLEAEVGNSAATGEPPTGLVLDLPAGQQGWTVRNAVVIPSWNAVAPSLTVTAAGGAVTAVTLGAEHGLGWDPYGTSVPVAFSGSCTAQATATVNSSGAIGSVSVTQGGVGCSSTTTASVNAAGTWDTAAPVNLVSGSNMTFFSGNLVKGNGGYTVWNASGAKSFGTQLSGGGGNLPGGGSYPALVASSSMGSALEADQFPGADFGAKLQSCLGAVSTTFGGTCDARNFTGNLSMASNLTISTGNTTILLPCATITTANQVIVTAGTRNVALRGCALRGGSAVSGSQGGTAFAYSGVGAMVQVGDPTYATDTMGFHMDNVVINTTAAMSASATGLTAYRTQEMDLENLYLLGNGNQTGITLDGTGNYTGGTFLDDQIGGFQTAVNAIGHQVANPATTDWMNASAFVRLHIDCPTNGGSPISGTYGINLQQGDGNTFTGGDVEGCSTALHLGANAQNNTIVGLRNENSTSQVVADAGSSYNNWMTGGTMFTGQLTDNGTRNSFLDTFHRSFNGLNGDWYGSQKDATVTNHYRLGTGTGNERGLLNEVQTDYGYRWLEGYSDATSGEQLYQVEDLLNNVNRLSIGQYNYGQSSTNNQTVINAAGTGAVVLNGSNNAGTGGVVVGSGGTSSATVATISNAGNAQFNGTLQVGSTAQSTGTMTVRNNADTEVDYYLWPGLTASQKGSFTYKDWNGNSQWYMVKDASNNWALNSAVGGLDSFKAYQSTNSGDTYVDASNSTGHLRLNYESGSGAETDIYSGSSSNLDAAFLGPTSIKLPGLAAGSGHSCLQIDNSGYLTNTGSSCSTASGTVGSGNAGQIAYYTGSGTAISGEAMVPLIAGGTGAASASAALANLGGVSLAGGTMTGALTAPQFNGPLSGNLTGNVTGNLTGNASTATSLAATPAQCAGNNFATGVTASGAANCTQVSYGQLGGTAPIFNQSTTGTASNVTGTVAVGNGGTGAASAAAALTSLGAFSYPGAAGIPYGLTSSSSRAATAADLTGLLGYAPLKPSNNLSDVATPATALANLGGVSLAGGTMTGALTAPQFNGPLSGSVTGNLTGNASTATSLAATPAQCAGNSFATGVTASGAANCTQVSYGQLGGTAPVWNQNTTGTASNVTGTVAVGNGGTGAASAAAALTSLGAFSYPGAAGIPYGLTSSSSRAATAADLTGLLGYAPLKPSNNLSDVATPATALTNLGGVSLAGGTMTGALTAPQFNGPLSGNVTGNLTGNASTATSLAATPVQCAGNNFATGVTASGAANCTQVSYGQLGGTAPVWNQNTTGTASNVTGTVAVANGGTGAANASAALASLGAFSYPGAAGIPYGLTSSSSRAATAADLTGLLGYAPLKPSNNLSDVATPATALANLGGQSVLPGLVSNGTNGINVAGNVAAGTLTTTDTVNSGVSPSEAQSAQLAATINNVHWSSYKSALEFGWSACTALGTGTGQCSNSTLNTNNNVAFSAMLTWIQTNQSPVYFPCGIYPFSTAQSWTMASQKPLLLKGAGRECTALYYTGSSLAGTNGNAALYITTGNSNFAAFRFEDISFIAPNAMYGVRGVQIGSPTTMNNVGFEGGGAALSSTYTTTAYSVAGYSTAAASYTTNGSGSGASFSISSVSGSDACTGITVSNGGSGFNKFDLIYLTQSVNGYTITGCTIQVASVSSGAVATVNILTGAVTKPYLMLLSATNTLVPNNILSVNATSGDALYSLNGTGIQVNATGGLSNSQIPFLQTTFAPGSSGTTAAVLTLRGQATYAATAYSVSGSGPTYTMTLTVPQTLSGGETITIGATSGDALAAINGKSYIVSPTGLTTTSIQFQETTITSGSGATSADIGVTGSAFEGEFFNAAGDLRNVTVNYTGVPTLVDSIPCYGNGLTFGAGMLNGTATSYASSQFTLTLPTVESCGATGLNLPVAFGATINNAQLSANAQNFLDACSSGSMGGGCNASGNTLNTMLLENPLVPDVFGNRRDVINNAIQGGNEGATVTGSFNIFNGGQFNGPLVASSTASYNQLQNVGVYGTGNLDNGTSDCGNNNQLVGGSMSTVFNTPCGASNIEQILGDYTQTGQTAGISQGSWAPFVAKNAGDYYICAYEVVTTTSTTSYTLPSFQIGYIDQFSGANPWRSFGSTVVVASSPATGTVNQSCWEAHIQANNTVYIATTGYATSGSPSMAYTIAVSVTYKGQ